jgi:hypothetical protein
MNPNPASSISDSAKGRAGRSNKLSLRALAQNLIVRARQWGDNLLSFPYARVVMIFVVGFAAGVVWHSYGSALRSWSPYLGWLAPPAANASYDRVRADLVAARQSLDKLGSDINRLEAQSANVPRRRTDR